MHLSQKTESEIRDLLERLFKDPNFKFVGTSIPYPMESLIYEAEDVAELVEHELDNLLKEQQSDGSLNHKYLYNFCNKYHLDFLKMGDGKQLIEDLKHIKDYLSEEIYDLYADEAYLNNCRDFFSPPKKLKLVQIGLLYYYISCNGGKFNQPDWYKVANDYNFTSKTSGIKIYQHYNKFQKKSNRTNYPSAAENIKKVISLLFDFPQSRKIAETDLTVAENWLQKKIN
jgi:hypothetical protein